MRTYPVKPLSLHERVHSFDEARPLNTLTVTGSFTMGEAHGWLSMCLSEIPLRPPTDDFVSFNFASTYNGGTQLQASYGKGKAVYRSDNLSTVAIIKDLISKEATRKQIKINVSIDVSEESIIHCLKIFHPKMEYFFNLRRKLDLAEALKVWYPTLTPKNMSLQELEANQDDISYLNDELRTILRSYEKLYVEFTQASFRNDKLFGMTTDLFIDKHKMAGKNARERGKQLLHFLQSNYSFENLVAFFNEPF
uniref:Sulfotransfer_1 domain-containing protein n=1 Tax=Steinernema glaseri TaxID=37863 RepID=A0A1I7YT33_9BILA